jgi:RNA polymerase sigma factor (TIGR02999 family)
LRKICSDFSQVINCGDLCSPTFIRRIFRIKWWVALAGNITQLLLQWRRGDQSALEQLMPLVYDELHKLARRCMRRERAGHTLQTTALVNEAYLRLANSARVQWQDRAHFFAIAAQLMRRVLVDEARKRLNQKRGGEFTRVEIDAVQINNQPRAFELLALDQALDRLAEFAPRKCKVVELRFFGGLSVEETALVLGVSVDIVKREWRTAKLWLLQELSVKPD